MMSCVSLNDYAELLTGRIIAPLNGETVEVGHG